MPDHRNLALTLEGSTAEKIEKALDEAFALGAASRHDACSHGFGYGLRVGMDIHSEGDKVGFVGTTDPLASPAEGIVSLPPSTSDGSQPK